MLQEENTICVPNVRWDIAHRNSLLSSRTLLCEHYIV